MTEAEASKITFGELDDVDMLRAIEDAFEIKLTAEETRRCSTVADIYALILAKVPHVARSAAPCTSAASYYALRRAVLKIRPNVSLTRNTPLRELLAPAPDAAWEELGRSTGLTMPRLELSRVGWALALLAMLISTSATVFHMVADAAGSEFIGVVLSAPLIAMFTLAAGAWIAGKFRLLRIPRHLHTFGELAKAVAATNMAKFSKAHGPARERELWFSLEYIIRDKLGWKGPITPDSRFAEQ